MATATATKGSIATKGSTTTKMQPLGDRVVILPTPREEMTKSGIVLPDTAKEKPQEGKIIAAGPGRLTDEGKREPMDVKEATSCSMPSTQAPSSRSTARSC